jgi:surface protein
MAPNKQNDPSLLNPKKKKGKKQEVKVKESSERRSHTPSPVCSRVNDVGDLKRLQTIIETDLGEKCHGEQNLIYNSSRDLEKMISANDSQLSESNNHLKKLDCSINQENRRASANIASIVSASLEKDRSSFTISISKEIVPYASTDLQEQTSSSESLLPQHKNTTSSASAGVNSALQSQSGGGFASRCCTNAQRSQLLTVRDKEKTRSAKNKTIQRRIGFISNSFHSLWICIAILLHMASKSIVEAVCTPQTGYICRGNCETDDQSLDCCSKTNHGDLGKARDACLRETPDGSCPIFAAASNGAGCNNGGVNGVIGDWDVSQVTDMSRIFMSRNLETSSHESHESPLNWFFNADISKWETKRVTKMVLMFAFTGFGGDEAVFNSDVSKWDTSSVTDTSFMFSGAKAFNSDVSKWNIKNLINMQNMFEYAETFNSDVSKWITSSVTTMSQTFHNAKAFNSDLSKWDTKSVTTMSGMVSGVRFYTCLSITYWKIDAYS